MATRNDAPVYAERLWPSLGFWAVVPLVGVGVGVSLWPVGAGAAVSGVVVVLALVVAGLVQASPRLEVGSGELRAGRARVPVSVLGSSQAYVGEQARQERGPRLDARAFLVLRGWVDPVLRIELTDPHDPTPYWLLSTRNPEALCSALEAAREDGRTVPPG